MSVRKLKAAEASAAVKDGRQKEQRAIAESAEARKKGWESEDKRFMSQQTFIQRRFMKLSLTSFASFSKQLIIQAYSRGIISEGQAKELVLSVDNRLWPEGRK